MQAAERAQFSAERHAVVNSNIKLEPDAKESPSAGCESTEGHGERSSAGD
jgi:hypothetical protein